MIIQDIFKSPLGQLILEAEVLQCDRYLPRIFGYHILQLTSDEQPSWTRMSPIRHKIIQCEDYAVNINIQAKNYCLPFQSDSIDVCILPHILESSVVPEQVCAEVNRILIPEGYLLLTGINPYSLWRIRKSFIRKKMEPNNKNQYYSLHKVLNWLRPLGFEIVDSEKFFFRPPVTSKTWLRRLRFMESLGQLLWPSFGGVYFVLAQKKSIPLTPIKLPRRIRTVPNNSIVWE